MEDRKWFFVTFSVITDEGLAFTRNGHVSLDVDITEIKHVRRIEKYLAGKMNLDPENVSLLSWRPLAPSPGY